MLASGRSPFRWLAPVWWLIAPELVWLVALTAFLGVLAWQEWATVAWIRDWAVGLMAVADRG